MRKTWANLVKKEKNNNFFFIDPQHVKKLIPWLEDQKIRHYKIEDRKDIQNVQSDQWQKAYEKYLEDVGCPKLESQLDQIEWLVGLAVRLEFEDNCMYTLIEDLPYEVFVLQMKISLQVTSIRVLRPTKRVKVKLLLVLNLPIH